MTILQLTNTRVSDDDFETRSLVSCSRALADAGHAVTLVTPDREPAAGLADRQPRFSSAASWPDSPASPGIPAGTPEVVHVHHPFLVGEEALRLAALHNAPLVFTATLRYENPFELPPLEAGHLRAFIEKLCVCFANRCDLVVAPSAAIAVRLFEGGVVRPIHVVSEDDAPEPRAARLAELYSEASESRRARGPVREGAAGGRLRELALAWNKVHPAAPFPVESARGISAAGLRDGSALPC